MTAVDRSAGASPRPRQRSAREEPQKPRPAAWRWCPRAVTARRRPAAGPPAHPPATRPAAGPQRGEAGRSQRTCFPAGTCSPRVLVLRGYLRQNEIRMTRHEMHPHDLPAWRDALGGLSQEEAAELCGMSRRSWQNWEQGVNRVPPWLLDWLRYRLVCREELRALELSFSEACLICDALNGYWDHDPSSGAWMWATIHDGVELNDLAAKWAVNGDRLVTRVRALSPGGRMALKDAVERFWARPTEPTEELLRDVGLTADDPPPELPAWLREGPPVAGDEWKGP